MEERRKIIRNVVILSVVGFAISVGFGMILPILPFLLLYFDGKLNSYPEELGRIPAAAGIAFEFSLIASAFMLTRAIFARYFGRLSDFIGRKRLIIIGMAGYVVTAILYILSRSWVHILLTRGLQGFFSAMTWPVAEAMMMDSIPSEERGRYMGWYMSMTNAGFIIGPALGGYTYRFIVDMFRPPLFESLIVPFFFLMAFSVFSLILSLFMEETILEAVRMKSPAALIKHAEIKVRLPEPISRSIMIIYLMGLANGIAVGFIMAILNVFVVQYITSDPAAIGLLSTVAGALGWLANYPSGRLSDSIGRKKLVIIGQLGTRLSTFLIPFARSLDQLLVIYTIRSISFNMSSPVYRALQADLVPARIRGKVFGTVQALFNIGAATSPLGGYIYEPLSHIRISFLSYVLPGPAILFWISAFIGLFTTMLFALFVVEPRSIKK